MKKLITLLFVVSISLNAADVEMKFIKQPESLVEFSLMWKIKSNAVIRPDKFLQLTLDYIIEEQAEKVSFILKPAPPLLKINCIRISFASYGNSSTVIYINGMHGEKFRVCGCRKILKGTKFSEFLFKYLPNPEFNFNKELVLLQSTDKFVDKCIMGILTTEKRKRFESFTLKVKAKLVNSQKMYMWSKLRPDTKGLTYKQAIKVLTANRDKIQNAYLNRLATLDDLFLAQSYIVELNKKQPKKKSLKPSKNSEYYYKIHVRDFVEPSRKVDKSSCKTLKK